MNCPTLFDEIGLNIGESDVRMTDTVELWCSRTGGNAGSAYMGAAYEHLA